MKSKYTKYRKLIKLPLNELLKRMNTDVDSLNKLLLIWLDQGLINERNPHLAEIRRIQKRKINQERQQKNEEDYYSYQYMRQEGYSLDDIAQTLERNIERIQRYDRRWYHDLIREADENSSLEDIHKETGIPLEVLKELEKSEKQRQEELELARQQQVKNNIEYAKSYLELIKERPEDCLIFDLEGVQQPDEIVEIAVININGEELLNTLVRPTHRIGYHVSQLTGITDSMASKGKGLYQSLLAFKEIADGNLLFNWGGEYDRVLLNSAMRKTGIKINCEFVDAQKIYSGIHESSDLIALYKAAGEVDQTHRALDDCYMLLDVIEDLLELEKNKNSQDDEEEEGEKKEEWD